MKSYFLFLFLLSAGIIYGQDNFKRGYIITHENDTISGWIDFRTDAQNMSVCKFKTEESGKDRSYLPGEIFGYRFDREGKFYVSRNVPINDMQRTVFLEYLVQGIKNLYYYIDTSTIENQYYYFFEDDAGNMVPVTKKPDEYINNKIQEDVRYVGMIKYLFQDQETILKKADKLKFDQKSMIHITKEYHDQVCTTGEECIVFETKEDKEYYQFKFFGSGGILLYNVQNEYFNIVISPVIGGGVNMFVPRFSKELSLQVDLAFSKIHGTRTYNNKNNPKSHKWAPLPNPLTGEYVWYIRYLTQREVNAFLIPLHIGFKYSYGNRKIHPVVAGGLSLNFAFGENYTDKYNNIGTKWVSAVNQEFNLIRTVGYWGAIGAEYDLNDKYSIFINSECIVSEKVFLPQFKLGVTF